MLCIGEELVNLFAATIAKSKDCNNNNAADTLQAVCTQLLQIGILEGASSNTSQSQDICTFNVS